MKTSTIGKTAKLLLIAFSVLIVSSCGIGMKPGEQEDIPADTPLSEFIIGRWKYEGKNYYEDYGYADIDLEYIFVDEKVIKIRAGDAVGTCSYQFLESGVISVDCRPRMLDLMTWSVKRDSRFLLIQRDDGEELKFERLPKR